MARCRYLLAVQVTNRLFESHRTILENLLADQRTPSVAYCRKRLAVEINFSKVLWNMLEHSIEDVRTPKCGALLKPSRDNTEILAQKKRVYTACPAWLTVLKQ